jgi:hypothetical protein
LIARPVSTVDRHNRGTIQHCDGGPASTGVADFGAVSGEMTIQVAE